jgi:hypothetical protein
VSIVTAIAYNGFSRGENWFFVLIGVVFVVGGIKGVITKEGRTRSKGGQVRHYSGRAAVTKGLMGVAVGIGVIAFGAISLM